MRSNTREAATALSLAVSRAKYMAADDSKKMQEAEVKVLHDESHAGVERFQQYGFTSVPLPPDQQQGGPAAEALIVYAGAHRSHPIILAVDDRRHRPTNWQPGDSGLYHYQGATAKLTATGWQYNAGSQNQPHATTVGNATLTIANGKITASVNGTEIVITDGKICFGGEGASIPVMLQSGPSTLLFSTK